METFWTTLQLFTIPLYGICFILTVELIKYLKVFHSIQDLELLSGSVARDIQDQKRVAIMFVGAVLAIFFAVFRDPPDLFNYSVKLLITYALATTCYENFIRFIKKAWAKYRRKIV